jgi:uncharacterized protein YdeI (YjbR/CyaY-like superfamily)
MKQTSSQVDAYIAKAAPFARPILERIRALFHEACPDIEETFKWSFPHFEYRGIVGSMAAFKEHVSFGFWKGKLLQVPAGQLEVMGNTTMAHGKVKNLEELPPAEVLLDLIHQAVALNEQGVKAPAPKKRSNSAEVEVPDYFLAALKKNKKALAAFQAFSPSHRREYVDWIVEAKQEATRQKRLATAIEWLAAGKSRNWKYERKK